MSARRQQKIGTDRPYRPILPTSGRHRQHIGTNRPYLPILPTSGRCRQKTGTHRPEDRHSSAIYADMADIRPTSAAYRDKSAIFADMADIRPMSAAYRDKSAIFVDICRYGANIQAHVPRSVRREWSPVKTTFAPPANNSDGLQWGSHDTPWHDYNPMFVW